MQNQRNPGYPLVLQNQGQVLAMNDDVGTGSAFAAVSRPSGQPINQGRWTREEHQRFLDGLQIHGKEWKKIADMISSRSVVQIRTHAQKYFQKVAKSTGGPVMSTSKKDDVVRAPVVKRRTGKTSVAELFSLASVSATMSAADTSPSLGAQQRSNMQGQQMIMIPKQQQQQQQQNNNNYQYQRLPPPPQQRHQQHQQQQQQHQQQQQQQHQTHTRSSKPVRRTPAQIQAIQDNNQRQQPHQGAGSYRKPNFIQVPAHKTLARGSSSSSSSAVASSSSGLKRKQSFGGGSGLSDDKESGGGATPRTMAAATILLHPRMQHRLQSGGDTPNTRQSATWLAAKQADVDAVLSKKRKSVQVGGGSVRGGNVRKRRGDSSGGSIDEGNLGPLAAATMMAISKGALGNRGLGTGSKRKHSAQKSEVAKRSASVSRHNSSSSTSIATSSRLAPGLSWEAVASSH